MSLSLASLLHSVQLILPVLLLAMWVGLTIYLLWPFYDGAYLPIVIGYSVFVLGYVYLFGFYGLLHWRAERYRLNSVSLFCFVTSSALIIILQIVYSIEVLTTYRSSYVVFVATYNIAVVMAPAYLNRVIHKPLDFPTFLKLKADDTVCGDVGMWGCGLWRMECGMCLAWCDRLWSDVI